MTLTNNSVSIVGNFFTCDQADILMGAITR